jgi:polyhydroxybutyrate depolymerase
MPGAVRTAERLHRAGWRRARAFIVALVVALAAVGVARARRETPAHGTIQRELVVDGVARTYLLHVGGPAKPGRPLVLVLHGWKGSAAAIERRTRATFDAIADRDGAIVVYPQALGAPPRWNDGWFPSTAQAPLADDVRFLSALVDALAAELAVDRARVFAAGLSNGASMVYRLACERPDLVAAIAPVSGTMSGDVARACPGGKPVSVIAMHGTADPLVPIDRGVHESVATWKRRDGCPATPRSSRLPDTDPADGTQTRVDELGPCAAGTDVAFYAIEGGGHAWPGGESPWGFVRRGDVPRDFDAAVVIWDFFQKHARRQ